MRAAAINYFLLILLLSLAINASAAFLATMTETEHDENSPTNIPTPRSNKTKDIKDTTTSSAQQPITGRSPEEIKNIQQLKRKEREKENILLAKRTLRIGSSEECDWRMQPLEKIKGEVCGAYYKVLGLDRKKLNDMDKNYIKKKYRQISLAVHPDKNPSSEATEAFKIITSAYECLLDDSCRYNYDSELNKAEERVAVQRKQLKQLAVEKALQAVNQLHYYVSVSCMHVYQTGLDLWELAGEIEWPLFGESRPIGQALMMATLLWKGRWLLQLHSLSYLVVRINYEIAKNRGLM